MSNFSELMQTNPARLVVQFGMDANGDESFQWGVVGDIPVLGLIGRITEAQHDLCSQTWMSDPDEHSALVITYDPADRTFECFCNDDIPTTPMVGMLEVIKGLLTTSRMAQHAGANQARILGPNGKSMRG